MEFRECAAYLLPLSGNALNNCGNRKGLSDGMSFTSFAFYAFLPLTFAGYWLLCHPRDAKQVPGWRLWLQNFFIVVASYVFYGWWDWRFLLLITLTAVWSWASGLRLERLADNRRRRLVVAVALIVNLGILGVFKYYNFFADSVVAVLETLGLRVNLSSVRIILPVGISFYTFQALSYVIDVYRQDIRPTKDIVAFLAFVSFFPQLVAGPIERATNLLPQFLAPRRFDYALAVDGCRQMLWGFFKKMVVADGCALAANNIFGAHDDYNSLSLLAGLFCFTFQIYGDFSGYSDIAIGCSKLFGIRLRRNFATPYFSRNIGEFWRRWHVSLTTWFKDYLYIPLGGSRGGLLKTIRNTFIIFAVSGLWHGANWTFVVWGLVHAVAFLPLLLSGRNRRFAGAVVAEDKAFPTLREIAGMSVTFFVVMLGWAFFRANTVGEALFWLGEIFTGFDFSLDTLAHKGVASVIAWILFMLGCEWFNRREQYGFAIYPANPVVRYFTYLLLMLLIVMNLSPRQTFIYFQF